MRVSNFFFVKCLADVYFAAFVEGGYLTPYERIGEEDISFIEKISDFNLDSEGSEMIILLTADANVGSHLSTVIFQKDKDSKMKVIKPAMEKNINNQILIDIYYVGHHLLSLKRNDIDLMRNINKLVLQYQYSKLNLRFLREMKQWLQLEA